MTCGVLPSRAALSPSISHDLDRFAEPAGMVFYPPLHGLSNKHSSGLGSDVGLGRNTREDVPFASVGYFSTFRCSDGDPRVQHHLVTNYHRDMREKNGGSLCLV